MRHWKAKARLDINSFFTGMYGINRCFVTLVAGVVVVGLGSCSSSAKRDRSASLLQPSASPVAMAASALSSATSHAELQRHTSQRSRRDYDRKPIATSTVPSKATHVVLYTSDSQCQALIPARVSVPSERSVTVAVGKILEEENTADLSLAGYRVNVDRDSGVATIDLRTATDSKWRLSSLSSCEQFALFGSLRKTLTSNAQWNIKAVRFTERGKEISL